MKYLLFIIIAGFFCAPGYAQVKDSLSKQSFEYYMHKKKSQRTVGFVFLGAGVGLTSLGIILVSRQLLNIFNPDKLNTTGGEILFWTGLASMVTSVPFFIAAGKNRKKAEGLHASLKMREITYPGLNTALIKRYPAITMTLVL